MAEMTCAADGWIWARRWEWIDDCSKDRDWRMG
jgi:hypothetical protein